MTGLSLYLSSLGVVSNFGGPKMAGFFLVSKKDTPTFVLLNCLKTSFGSLLLAGSQVFVPRLRSAELVAYL